MARAEKPAGVLLAPGAGADRNHATLVAIEEVLAPFPVDRFDIRSRSTAKAVATVEAAIAAMTERTGVAPKHMLIGGRSFGGRMCSMAAAAGVEVGGLVLLSYPLHPPGKPDKLRVEHFGDIAVPCLFVSGDRDPFGTPAEFADHTSAIAGSVEHVWLDGAGHSPKSQTHESQIIAAIKKFARL